MADDMMILSAVCHLLYAAAVLACKLEPSYMQIPGLLIPAHGLLEGIYDTIGIVAHAEVAKAFKSGAIKAHKAEVVELGSTVAHLSDGRSVKVSEEPCQDRLY